MAKKINWLKTKWGFVTLNIGIAIVLAVLLVFAVSFTLRRTTQHGIEIEVPSITGDYIEAARLLCCFAIRVTQPLLGLG